MTKRKEDHEIINGQIVTEKNPRRAGRPKNSVEKADVVVSPDEELRSITKDLLMEALDVINGKAIMPSRAASILADFYEIRPAKLIDQLVMTSRAYPSRISMIDRAQGKFIEMELNNGQKVNPFRRVKQPTTLEEIKEVVDIEGDKDGTTDTKE